MTPERSGSSLAGGWPVAGQATPSSLAGEVVPELEFSVVGAGALAHAVVPSMRFDLEIDAGGARIRSLSLNVQVRIVAPQRGYDGGEEERLFEVFGAPRDWGRSLRTLMWAQAALVVPPFEGIVKTQLHVPCSYDFDVAANKYLHALRKGVIPLEFLFSGSVFYQGPGGALRTVRLSWEKETRYDMPTSAWHDLMQMYFPNSAWLRLRQDVFERLAAYRSAHGHPTWESTIEALVPERSGPSTPPTDAAE